MFIIITNLSACDGQECTSHSHVCGPTGVALPHHVPALGPRLDKGSSSLRSGRGTGQHSEQCVHSPASVCDIAQTQPDYKWPHTVI